MTAAVDPRLARQHGGFTAVDELLEVDGIGEATLADDRAATSPCEPRGAGLATPRRRTCGCRCSGSRPGRVRCSARAAGRPGRRLWRLAVAVAAPPPSSGARRRGSARWSRRWWLVLAAAAGGAAAAGRTRWPPTRSPSSAAATARSRRSWHGHLRPAAGRRRVRRPGDARRLGCARSAAGAGVHVAGRRCSCSPVPTLARRAAGRARCGSAVGSRRRDGDDLAAAAARARRPGGACAPPGLWWRRRGRGAAVAARVGVAPARGASARWCRPWWSATTRALTERRRADFRTTGLTHLLAVSGTNLTLVVGFLLLAGRWCGVRGRWPYVVGAASGIVGFVLLARTEPSVLRAAAMGTVALRRPRRRRAPARPRGRSASPCWSCCWSTRAWPCRPGSRCRCWPRPGSCCSRRDCATPSAAGCPRWLAEAVAVPLAAQLACTPVVAAISGQVSLVAVARQPARRARGRPGDGARAGRRAASGWSRASPAERLGTLAGWCVAWIVVVAERGAALPAAAVGWGTGARRPRRADRARRRSRAASPRLLRRPVTGVWRAALAAGRRGPGAARRPRAGRRPAGSWWRATSGQGDALVLRAGPGTRGRRRRRARPAAGRPLPRPARRRAGAAAGADPLPRRPRRRAARASRRPTGRRGRRDPVRDPPRARRRSWTARPRPGRGAGVRRDAGRRRRHPPDALAAARRAPAHGRLANDASVVLLVEIARASGSCSPATSSPRPGWRWRGPGRGSRSTCSRSRTTAAASRTSLACCGSGAGVAGRVGRRDNDYGHPSPRDARPARRRPARRCCGPTSTATSSWCGDGGRSSPSGRAGGGGVGALWQAGPAMAGPRASDVLGRVTLVTGKEEFLGERTVAAVRAAVRGHDAEAELSETGAADLTLATLGEMAAPSLFSTTRCVVVRGPGGPARRVGRRAARLLPRPRPRTSRWCSCTAAARRAAAC